MIVLTTGARYVLKLKDPEMPGFSGKRQRTGVLYGLRYNKDGVWVLDFCDQDHGVIEIPLADVHADLSYSVR